MTTEKAHATLSASAAERWLNCPGSVRLTKDLPDETSIYAEEGTRAHDLAEQILLGKQSLEDHPDFAELVVYIDFVKEISAGGELHVEERLAYTDWVPEGFGTSDTVVIKGDIIHIADLKWGKGVKVYADGNPQMRLYALGALQRWMFDHELNHVEMSIVQPRLDHISTDRISVDELLEWGESIKPKAQLALTDKAPVVPGEKQCKWCKVKTRCRKRAVEVLSTNTDTELLTADEMALLLPQAQELETWAKEFQAGMLDAAMSGQTIPGYKLVEGRSVRRWSDNASEVLSTAVENSDQLYEKKLLGIGAIEKLVGKDLVNTCTVKPAGKPALVPSTDKRPAIVAQNVEFPTGE